MFGIPDSVWANLTPSLLLLILVFLMMYFLMTGKLRTAIAVREIRQDRDDRLADYRQQIDDWKEAHAVSEKGRELQTQVAREALEASRTNEEIIKGLRVALELAKNEN